MRYALASASSVEPLDYLEFVRAKAVYAPELGLPCRVEDVHPLLHRHQPVLVQWLVEGGRRALFANFGLGKTMIQLEAMRLVKRQVPDAVVLIVIPLTVVTEFKTDAAKLGVPVKFVRTTEEIFDAHHLNDFSGIFLTNYESVREGKIDTSRLTAVSLDEASCLREASAEPRLSANSCGCSMGCGSSSSPPPRRAPTNISSCSHMPPSWR
jgi:SNF2 family DNA or RNA helicase